MIAMTSLFQRTYPDTPEGMATESLARVVTVVEDHMGMTMDDETLFSVLIELQRIRRDDLPEGLQSAYDATCWSVGMAWGWGPTHGHRGERGASAAFARRTPRHSERHDGLCR